MGRVPALLYFNCIAITLAYLLDSVNNQKHNLYINTMNVIDSTVLFFGIFVTFYLWHWNISTNEQEKKVQVFSFLLFQSTSKNQREKICSHIQWHLGVHIFSPLITLSLSECSQLKFPAKSPYLVIILWALSNNQCVLMWQSPGLSYQFSWQECCQVSFVLFWTDELISQGW